MCAENILKKESTNWKDQSLTLADGVQLISRIWTPKDGGPWPALLMRQPYGRSIASTVTYSHPNWIASQGYVVVVQDVRGQEDSSGKFQGFTQEAIDTSQTHDWVRSLPECNGKIGTYGFSYQGLTQLISSAGSKPPDCLIPAMTGLDELEHWCCDGGAHWWHLGLALGIQLAALKAKKERNKEAWHELHESLEDGTYLKKGKELLARHDPNGMALRWLNTPDSSRDLWPIHEPLMSWLQKPMLLIGGWWDPHLQGIFDLYIRSKRAGGSPELHIGPATHLQWWDSIQQTQLNFLNKHLKPKKNSSKKKTNIRFWNISTNNWETPNKLNKNNSSLIKGWGLFSKGLACVDSRDGVLAYNTNGDGEVKFVHDPWRPVPSLGGHLSPKPGPANRRELDLRSDVATFTSKPFKKKLDIYGIPSLKVIAYADQPGFDLCLALSIVNTEKQPIVNQISTGFLRISGEDAFNETCREVFFQPILSSLHKGEQLRISIAGSAWPAIGVNPGSETLTSGYPTMDFKVITLTLRLAGSMLKLNEFPCLKDF